MGIKTIRVCDITGEEISLPVNIGFSVDGEDIKLEISHKVAQRFVIALANRVDSDVLAEVAAEVFGKDWREQSQWLKM